MHHITLEIQDQEKAQQLYGVLRSLDFVTQISTDEPYEHQDRLEEAENRTEEFFSYAGLWADRDISVTTLRQQAWPRQTV